MTKQELKIWLEDSDLTQAGFARSISRPDEFDSMRKRINNYCTGHTKVPGWIEWVTRNYKK